MRRVLLFALALTMCGCDQDDPVRPLELLRVFIGTNEVQLSGGTATDMPVDRSINLIFSGSVDQASAAQAITLSRDQQAVAIALSFLDGGSSVVVVPAGTLLNNTLYQLTISGDLRSADGGTFAGKEILFRTQSSPLEVTAASFGNTSVGNSDRSTGVPRNLDLTIEFSAAVNTQSLRDAVKLTGPDVSTLSYSFTDGNKAVTITTTQPLQDLMRYQFTIGDELRGAEGELFDEYSLTLYTARADAPKFPLLADDALLTLVQEQTFKYFWDFAHPASGMARERNSSGNLVTSGGSGFGIMALIVGMERGFISRQQGLERMATILTFLEGADRFHGAWPHWMNGNTGDVIPFSPNDNGGDLVETSFLVQGLLTFRQYLDDAVVEEKSMIDRIQQLWETVEWDWYTRGGQNVLFWHWSPDKQWAVNLPIRGYNESLITYVLAAASPTHPVDAAVYHEGWARNGAITNGQAYFGINLPLGYDYGGPLFFAHYSFLGLDPRNLRDTYANYWTQNVNHSRINHAYAVANPKNFVGYSDENWGLTASDNQDGYSAHSPTNDLGVITPTAALSSFPYTPEESMKALKFFYYTLGDRLWGPYGFYDAFNLTEAWTADSYLAIDQGPIIVMIENYRSGLLWNLFMSAPEVQTGLDRLGFTR